MTVKRVILLWLYTYIYMLETGSLEEEMPNLQILAKTQTCPLLLVQSPCYFLQLPFEFPFASSLIFAVKKLLYSYFFFLARLICPSACCYHFLQIHSYIMCWLTSLHHKAALTIHIIHRSRHFAMERDSSSLVTYFEDIFLYDCH